MAEENYCLIKDGVVENVVIWDGDTDKWSPPSGYTCIKSAEWSSPDGLKVQYGVGDKYDGSSWSHTDDRSTDQKWKDLREHRDSLLTDSDWMAVGDRTQSDAEKKYRQDLRDLPANTSDPGNPTFPTKP